MNQKAGSHWTQSLPGPPSASNFLVSKTVRKKQICFVYELLGSRTSPYSSRDGLKQYSVSVSSRYVFENGCGLHT